MINILYAGNNKVFDGILISILSMRKHTKKELNIICLTMDLTEKDARFLPLTKKHENYLNDVVKKVNPNSKVSVIDATDVFKKSLMSSVNLGNHFTPYAMLRLLVDQIDGIPDKFIYLDADTMINNDISTLFDIDINDYELGVVKDSYNWIIPSRWGKNYFNSGVLLVNLAKSKETGLFKKAVDLCNNKKMLFADQSALNIVCEKKLMLPLKFNAKDKYKEDIVVHHFCNVRKNNNFFHRIKPWEVDLVKDKMDAYDDILDDYTDRKNSENFPV